MTENKRHTGPSPVGGSDHAENAPDAATGRHGKDARRIRSLRTILGRRWFGRDLSLAEMGRVLRLAGDDPGETVRFYERGKHKIRGPLSLALDLLEDPAGASTRARLAASGGDLGGGSVRIFSPVEKVVEGMPPLTDEETAPHVPRRNADGSTTWVAPIDPRTAHLARDVERGVWETVTEVVPTRGETIKGALELGVWNGEPISIGPGETVSITVPAKMIEEIGDPCPVPSCPGVLERGEPCTCSATPKPPCGSCEGGGGLVCTVCGLTVEDVR